MGGLLICCAAAVEARPLDDLHVVRLGVGKAAAAAAATERLLRELPDAVLLFGVCGAYPARHRAAARLRVGDLCVVSDDRFVDEGVDTPGEFLDLRALGLGDDGPFAMHAAGSAHAASLLSAPQVRAATVSTCAGTESLSAARCARADVEIETMEGAAVAVACQRLRVPLLQLRAVSNFCGDRERGAWDLALALQKLAPAVRRLVDVAAAGGLP